MLDINLFRVEKGGNPELIRESQRRRFANVELVDEVIAIDKQWRQRKNLYLFLSTKSLVWIYLCFLNLGFGFCWVVVQFDLENLRKDFNKINKQVAQLRIVSLLIFYLSFRVFGSYFFFFILGSTSFLALRCL